MGVDKDLSQTFARGLSVLRAFDGTLDALSIPDIARRTGLNRTVTRRLVFTLRDLGYVREHDHRYAPTPRVLRLAHGFLRYGRVGAAVQPALLETTRRLGLPVSLAMRDDLEAIYVAHAPADPSLVTEGFTIGTPLPLAGTAIGRVLMAFESEDERSRLLEQVPLEAHTAQSCTDRHRLGEVLEVVRQAGFAHAVEQFEPGVASIAVPVNRRGGGLLAAIGLATARGRLDSAGERVDIVTALQDCAGRLATVI